MSARPEILGAPPAEHGGRGGEPLDFSGCVNAFGPAPEVVEAVRAARLEAYPDPTCRLAREAASRHWGLAPAEVTFGAGAAELIFAAAFAFIRPGDGVVVAAPAFAEYGRAAALCGGRVREVRGEAAFQPDGDELARAIGSQPTRLVFVASPSSPAGQARGADEIVRLADRCAAAGALLVLDQSYDAFTEHPLALLPAHPALLTLRSLTKDHALAGLRLGAAIGPREVIRALDQARMPWTVSAPAQAAACAALTPAGDAHLAATLPRLRAERVRIERGLAALGVPTVPTETHYLLAAVGGAAELTRRLAEDDGVRLRDCTSFGLPEYIRIAARTPSENDTLLAAMARAASHPHRPHE